MFPTTKFAAIKCPYEPKCPRSFQCIFSHHAPEVSPTSRKRTYDVSQIQLLPQVKKAAAVKLEKEIIHKEKIVSEKKAIKKSNIVIDLSRPPYLKPDINSKVPRATREKSLLKYFEEFGRIYAPLLSDHPDLAHLHAYKQEEAIHLQTSKLTYSSKSVGVLQRLRKRGVAESPDDIGIDGEWIAKPKRVKTIPPIDELKKLKMPDLELVRYKYPLWPTMRSEIILEAKSRNEIFDEELAILEEDDTSIPKDEDCDDSKSEQKKSTESTNNPEQQVCDRCSKVFLVKHPLKDYEKVECHYHYGTLRSTMIEGSKVRAYTCCESLQGASGCCVGPHVFKEETIEKLNQRIPFVEFKDLSLASKDPHLFLAMDCEMSYTTAGMECTRVTVVSWDGDILLDELVLPSSPVLDLNTRWSGISDLSNAKYTLPEIQNKIASFCSSETILAGHGLENDLKVLRMIHTCIIDTAFLFPHIKGFPFRNSLRSLVTRYLGRFIQTSASGHDSYEDTLAVVQLVKEHLKTRQDLWWKAKTIDSWCFSFNTGKKIGLISLDKNVFASIQRNDLIAKALKYEASWRAQGTESTKNLGQVKGSTRKPFPQKGRGKARVGTLRAPHFRGGYASHGPRPHNKTTDIPKKVYDAALRSAISTKYAQDQVLVVDSFDLSEGSKTELQEKLQGLQLEGKKIYFVHGDQEPNSKLINASDLFTKKRNSTHGEVENPLLVSWVQHISVTPILDNEFLVLDKAAVEVLEEMYSIK